MRMLLDRLYPEIKIAGFSRVDQRVIFFNQVNAILTPEMSVLDFGAGRGKWVDVEQGYKLELTTLRGKCREVIGADVVEEVRENPLVDSAVVIDPAEPLPFADDYFDLIVSWAVFEHVENAEAVAKELARVLKPGGWLCAWTPSKWSYFAIAARMIPLRFHRRVIRWTSSAREDKDVFPIAYKLNTMGAINRYFSQFDNCSYYYNGAPSYHANSMILARLWQLWMWLLPAVFSQQLHIFLRKRKETSDTD
jgi:SAM-dependent methyltransferase